MPTSTTKFTPYSPTANDADFIYSSNDSKCPKNSVPYAPHSRNDLWRYPKETFRAMASDPAHDCWTHDDTIGQSKLPLGPSDRTDLSVCMDWLIRASDGGEEACLGGRPHQKDVDLDKPIRWQTRTAFRSTYHRLAEGLRNQLDSLCPSESFEDVGYRTKDGSYEQTKTIRPLGILLQNDPVFCQFEFACQLVGVTLVPLYSTLGSDALFHIMHQTQLKSVVVDYVTLERFLDTVEDMKSTKEVTSMSQIILSSPDGFIKGDDDYTRLQNLLKRCDGLGLKVITLSALLADAEMGDDVKYSWKSEDLWTICYTSGTTGQPKGVMLTQGNFMNTTYDVMNVLSTDLGLCGLNDHRSYFSYLPLAHIFERVVVNATIMQGYRVAFHTGNLATLFEEVKAAETTLLCAVPRVLEKLRSKVIEAMEAKGYIATKVFNRCLFSKTKSRQQSGSLTHLIADMILMNAIKAKIVGPHLNAIVSGGAPLCAKVRTDIQAILSCPIVNGYGLTESTGPIFVQHSSDVPLAVGWLFRSGRCRLSDVPDLDYLTKNNDGELLLQGHGIFCGYFRQQQATEDAFVDGWFRTGDVSHIDLNDGGVKIIDRVKNCFKLGQGEYIAPEKIENVLKLAPSVEQVIIAGKSTENHCLALISLSESFIAQHTTSVESELVVNPLIQAQVVADLNRAAKKAKLMGFEIPKGFIFLSRSLQLIDNFFTPTLKLRRNLFAKAFDDVIDRAYSLDHSIAIDVDKTIRGDPCDDLMLSIRETTIMK